jgi:hypothetical protein
MSDKRLDKLFKEKLSDRDFDYQDSYWTDFENSFNIDAAVNSGSSFGNIISGIKIGIIAIPVVIITGLAVFVPNNTVDINTTQAEIINETKTAITNSKNEFQNTHVNDIKTQTNEKITGNETESTLRTTSDDFSDSGDGTSISALASDSEEPPASGETNGNPTIIDTEINQNSRADVVSFNDNSGPENSTQTQTKNNINRADQSGYSSDNHDPNNVAIIGSMAIAENENRNDGDFFYNPDENSDVINAQSNRNESFEIDENSSELKGLGLNGSFIVMSKSLDGSETQVDSTLKTKQGVIGAYRPNRIRPVFSIAANGGVAFISKKLSTTLAEFTQMVSLRNEYEANKTAIIIGLEFETRYRGFSFTSGINRMSWGENVEYESSPETLVVTDTTYIEIIDNSYWEVFPIDSILYDSTYIVDIDTTFIQFTDTLFYEPSDNLDQANGKTKITYVEIPILVGYEFYFNKIILALKGGVSVGFLTKTYGYYLNEPTTGLIPINTGYSVIRKTLFNLEFGVGVGYKFYPKFDVFIGAGYKMNLNSVFSDSGIIQKYKAITLGIKLRYTF